MGDYNPRQITQMRWKDVKQLEKFKFISGNFNFGNETLEHVSQDKEYAKLINIMKTDINDDFIPILLYDIPNQSLFTGCYSSTAMFLCTVISAHELEAIDISYEPENDKMIINDTSEEMLSADNVKTLFGEQSIIGTGNIDLFNHFLTITTSDGSKLYINYPSSKNLECDSLQDLTQMTKAVNGTKIGFGSTYINYNGFIWQTANSTAITAVSDVVTTL